MADLTEQEKWQMIENVDATMRLSGMPLTEKDKQRLKDIIDGKITVDESIAEITRQYQK